MKHILAFSALLLASLLCRAQQPEEEAVPVVNWGVKVQANASNFRMKNIPTMPELTSQMNIGGELGGFIDFNISRRFRLQFNLLWGYEQNTLDFGDRTAPMRAAVIEVPVFALWRFGDARRGWLNIGGGPYTEFIVWGELEGVNPFRHVITDDATGQQNIVTADSHSGLAAFVGYELPCGLRLNATYHFGISDMLLFEHNSRDTYQRPQKVTLGLGWRF